MDFKLARPENPAAKANQSRQKECHQMSQLQSSFQNEMKTRGLELGKSCQDLYRSSFVNKRDKN
jgi:hypothetical protein